MSYRTLWIALSLSLVGLSVEATSSATADPATCGSSAGHALCITVPSLPLTGEATIQISNEPNRGKLRVVWMSSAGSELLVTRFRASGSTGDYSFIWPTQKYLDGSGVLKARIGKGDWVKTSATLANGNTTDFQHSASDWEGNLPDGWTGGADPVVAASGDGPDDSIQADSVSDSILATDPALFLFLGDVYEKGTFVEYRTMYGASALDGAGSTSWGRLATRTQPTIGNHEHKRLVEFSDYWHGRPQYLSFTFGGVLFLDLNSSASMQPGSPQYTLAQQALDDAPPCIVTFFHIPVLSGSKIATNKQAMWELLADNGGDLVLNGHNHFLMEYEPLAADLTTPGHMVELISGAGGAGVKRAKTDPVGRIAWSLGKTPGALYLTLEGAAAGGDASAVSWRFELPDGSAARTGRVVC